MAMIQLHVETPILTYLVKKTTTADDLVHFIVKAVGSGFLKNGDFVVMDNSRVHNAGSKYRQQYGAWIF